ncbi:MAG TPA: hypothetical protein VGL06_30300 [Pseudonocardiaceae bacterium]
MGVLVVVLASVPVWLPPDQSTDLPVKLPAWLLIATTRSQEGTCVPVTGRRPPRSACRSVGFQQTGNELVEGVRRTVEITATARPPGLRACRTPWGA